jgi:hypothetical protein
MAVKNKLAGKYKMAEKKNSGKNKMAGKIKWREGRE